LTHARFLARLSIRFKSASGGKEVSVTVPVSKIQNVEPLKDYIGESAIRSEADSSFQQFLEDEQKRLSLLFSPVSGFNFSSLFEYGGSTFQESSQADTSIANIFSDIASNASDNSFGNKQFEVNLPINTQTQNNAFNPIDGLIKPTYSLLQTLLAKSGWFIPNLESRPAFYLAQMQGNLLSKLDLQSLVDKIVSQVNLVKEKGKIEFSLGLKPDDLGQILLTLISRSGMISIEIQAAEETRKMMEAQRDKLMLALKKANVNVSEIKISRIKEANQNV
jgi:hypothetical protein